MAPVRNQFVDVHHHLATAASVDLTADEIAAIEHLDARQLIPRLAK
jgi:hypothetical protein